MLKLYYQCLAFIPPVVAILFSSKIVMTTSALQANGSIHFGHHSPFKPKLVLVDRDGVINEDVGSPGVICKSQFELTPNAGEAIGKLKRTFNCPVVLITNQSCVGKGLLTLSELEKIHIHMRSLLLQEDSWATIDRIYVCTSVEERDIRKKPNPGMITEACIDWGIDIKSTLDMDCVFFIGDSLTDMQAAKRSGIRNRILVETGYGFDLMGGTKAESVSEIVDKPFLSSKPEACIELIEVAPFLYAKNLEKAVDWILQG
mmetsp:Transcript_20512/g.41929  ORF Transcript_20512/g.41929 Transcript_20512/m.41929 type:complete len:259 (+) Transcript_20512:181-957(+)